MEVQINEEDVVKVALDAELKKLRDTCDELKDELKKFTQPLKQAVRDKSNASIMSIESRAAEMAEQVLSDNGAKAIIDEIVNGKVLDILSPVLGFERDENGHFKKDGRITVAYSPSQFLRDEAEKLVGKFIHNAISDYLEKMDFEQVVQKSLNGMTAEHVEMVNFARNLAKSLKDELGEAAFGDNAAAQLIQTISWEMKGQRDKKKYRNSDDEYPAF